MYDDYTKESNKGYKFIIKIKKIPVVLVKRLQGFILIKIKNIKSVNSYYKITNNYTNKKKNIINIIIKKVFLRIFYYRIYINIFFILFLLNGQYYYLNHLKYYQLFHYT